jgi:hypothetical protein
MVWGSINKYMSNGFWSENELGENPVAIGDLASAILAPTGEQAHGGD